MGMARENFDSVLLDEVMEVKRFEGHIIEQDSRLR